MNPETPVSSGQATQRSTTSRESPTPESRQASSARPRHAACLSCRAKKLKCDGSRVCPNCARFNVNCVYDRVVRKTGPKKGYLRNLEERLRKAESLYGQHNFEEANQSDRTHASIGPSQTGINNEDVATERESSFPAVEEKQSDESDQPAVDQNRRADTVRKEDNQFASTQTDQPSSKPRISHQAIEELTTVYFARVHPTVPIIHPAKFRRSAVQKNPTSIPKCLKYIMWSLSAALLDKYRHLEEYCYREAKRHMQADEMNGYGETSVSVAHCQTWILISHYEIKRALFPRAWPSIGQAVRFSQMLQLHRLDDPQLHAKQVAPNPNEWVEKEERRRIFWLAYCLDRYAGMGTGWPLMVDEDDILTNLPSSEEAFEDLTPTESLSLADALEPKNIELLSSLGAIVLTAFLAGRNLNHLKQRVKIGRPRNKEDDFWRGHQELDLMLSEILLNLPDRLRLPFGIDSPNVVFVNMNLQALTICLHQTAVIKASRSSVLRSQFGEESEVRCVAAALAIKNTMRMVSHTDLSALHVFTPFCLFVAARAFIQQLQSKPSEDYRSSLRYIAQAIHTLKRRNPLAEIFMKEIAHDMERAGISLPESTRSTDNSNQGVTPRSKSFIEGFTPIFDPQDKRAVHSDAIDDTPMDVSPSLKHHQPSNPQPSRQDQDTMQSPISLTSNPENLTPNFNDTFQPPPLTDFTMSNNLDYWSATTANPGFSMLPFFPFIPQVNYVEDPTAQAPTQTTPVQRSSSGGTTASSGQMMWNNNGTAPEGGIGSRTFPAPPAQPGGSRYQGGGGGYPGESGMY